MSARVLPGWVLFLCTVIAACAVPGQYGPFESGERVNPFRILEVESREGEYPAVPRHDDFVHRTGKDTDLRIDWADDGKASVTLSRDAKQLFSGPLKGYGSPMAGAGVYAADLNADGRPDYVIFTHSGGCGLASQAAWITFLLSASSGYAGTSVLSYAAEPSDFIAIGDRACLVQTSFVYGPVGKDGRQHNYWVYNLLSFSGTELVLANNRDRRFPKWVWFSFAENHRDTDQLTATQRRLTLKQILAVD